VLGRGFAGLVGDAAAEPVVDHTVAVREPESL
jgi:hypothetical protein